MTRTIMFEELSVYTISCVFFLWVSENICFRVAIVFSSSASKGREGGFHFIVDYVFFF